MTRPQTDNPGPYSHRDPGWKCSGWRAIIAAVDSSVDSVRWLPPTPDVWVIKSRSVTSRASASSLSAAFLNCGRYLDTGSLTDSLPSSCRIITAVAVTGLVIEAMQKMLSVRIGRSFSTSARPTAAR